MAQTKRARPRPVAKPAPVVEVELEEPDSSRPSPRNIALLVCCIAGLGVSIYLTLAHYSSAVTLVCDSKGAINCEKVTTSAESVVFGIPVAVLGLCYFVPMLVLCLPRLWKSANPYIAPIRLGASVVGLGFVFYLLYSELFVIHAICLWCSSVHLLTFIIFCLLVTGYDEASAPARFDR